MITVRQAVKDDIPIIMRFLDENWKKNYILALDYDFFCWQFCRNNQVNIIIAIDDEEKIMYGLQGYIYYNNTASPDIGGSIWKTIKSDNPGLGLEFAPVVKEVTNYRWYSSPGLSERGKRACKVEGYEVGMLKHFYRLGDCKTYNIAKISDNSNIPYEIYDNVRLTQIETIEQFKAIFSNEYLNTFLPFKDVEYYEWRYYNHPVYSYKIYGIKKGDDIIKAAIVLREVSYLNSKALKIVDYIGDAKDIQYIGQSINDILALEDYEYVDFYQYGIDDEYLNRAGMRLRGENDVNIIPNYFEPFVQENVEICFKKLWGDFRMTRGDGDQDRPSQVRRGEVYDKRE